jgi:hypothetical protein
MSRLADRSSSVGISIEACDATLAALQRQGVALCAEPVMPRFQDEA